MKKCSKTWLVMSLAAIAAVGACTNEEDLGGRDPEDGAGDAGAARPGWTDGDAAGAFGGDATTDATTGGSGGGGYGRTAAGESCNPEDYPPAPASCRIPGLYDVVEYVCAGGVCENHAIVLDAHRWIAEVTVSGSEVKLTNGVDRLLKCTLDGPCDCVRSGGSRFRFTATGFVLVSRESCPGTPGVTLYTRNVGTKR